MADGIRLTSDFQVEPLNSTVEKYIDNEEVGLEFANLLYKYAEPFTPYDTGNLQRNVTITPFLIKYHAPYARRLFYGFGFNFSKEKHINATSMWTTVAYNTHSIEIAKALTDFIAKGESSGE